jgi:hypothetical protein
MQNAADQGIAIQPGDRNDAYRSIVSDVVSLIEHVQASLELIESAIARETSLGDQDASSNVIVLDDVTPRYAKARAALYSCDADLDIALHFLLDSRPSKRGAREFAGNEAALRSFVRKRMMAP